MWLCNDRRVCPRDGHGVGGRLRSWMARDSAEMPFGSIRSSRQAAHSEVPPDLEARGPRACQAGARAELSTRHTSSSWILRHLGPQTNRAARTGDFIPSAIPSSAPLGRGPAAEVDELQRDVARSETPIARRHWSRGRRPPPARPGAARGRPRAARPPTGGSAIDHAPTQGVDSERPRGQQHPCLQTPALRVAAVVGSPELHERVLYEVLCGLIVAEHHDAEAIDPGRQLVVEHASGTLPTGREVRHQSEVAARLVRSHVVHATPWVYGRAGQPVCRFPCRIADDPPPPRSRSTTHARKECDAQSSSRWGTRVASPGREHRTNGSSGPLARRTSAGVRR